MLLRVHWFLEHGWHRKIISVDTTRLNDLKLWNSTLNSSRTSDLKPRHLHQWHSSVADTGRQMRCHRCVYRSGFGSIVSGEVSGRFVCHCQYPSVPAQVRLASFTAALFAYLWQNTFLSLSLRCKNVIWARRMNDKKVCEYVSILFAWFWELRECISSTELVS